MSKIIKKLYEGHRPNIDEFVDELGPKFDLLYLFKDTPQDHIWHAEGNVHIHTNMVLQEVYKLIDSNNLNIDDQVTLILAALFHDIAKPITTIATYSERDKRDCIKSPKHEIMGRDYLAYRLLDLELNEYVYKNVISLVAYHQIPKLLVIKNEPKSAYVKHMKMVNYELMYLLEVADMKGRICPDIHEQIGYLDLYKMFCDEYKVNITDSYNHIVGTYLMSIDQLYSLDEAEQKLWNHKEHSNVTIMCGIPGSGKSSSVSGNVISLDEIRKELGDTSYKKTSEAMVIAKERMKEYLRNKQDFTYDATNYRKDFRKKIFDLCHDYHAKVTLHMVMKPLKKCIVDNKDRKNPVEDSYIIKQFERFEYPEYGEYHDLKITIVK